MAKLSDKDFEILDFIYREIKANGYPPTVREIGAAVGLNSPATVHAHIAKLEAAGKIEKSSAKNRTLKVVNYPEDEESDFYETHEEYAQIPVYGKITAGVPITAVEQLERYFPIPISYVGNNDMFMLKVSGESMINAGILDGDYVIIEKTPSAANGDIVAALINGEDATIKTFYKENGHYRLQPENDYMDPIIATNVEIIGKVAGVFRMFK